MDLELEHAVMGKGLNAKGGRQPVSITSYIVTVFHVTCVTTCIYNILYSNSVPCNLCDNLYL